jgi:hypothetical protein
MAQFVLVANGITNVQFEKAMEIKIRSGNKVAFVPQGAQQGQGQSHGVGSGAMTSTKQQNAEDLLTGVRFEWPELGAEFGADIVRALAGHHHPEEAH